MIKEKELQKAVVSNKLITHKATDLTIMSYDKNVHKLIIPTDLTQAEISDIIVLITFRHHENVLQISGELVEDKIEIILPNEIRSLSGEFYIEIDINLTDNRQITFARYWGKVVKSDIDSVDLDDAQEFYFELFDDFVQKVADKSEVAVTEIDAHKQAVSDKADTAIAVITDASNKVTTAKQSALTSIAQATSDVTDASTQFTADLADTQSTIDAQVTQAQDTLTAVNDKVATVNDTADGFMADMADKSQLVDDKYQQFDDNVTTAGQTIDDILGLADDVQQVSAQVAEKVQNFKLKNEVVNGDFSRGTTSWRTSAGALFGDITDNEIEILITDVGVSSAGIVQDLVNYNTKYISAEIYSYGNVERVALGNLTMYDKWGVGWKRFSLTTPDSGTQRFYARDTVNLKFKVRHPLIIDLTQTFGAGNEPTKEEMDRLVEMVQNQWWDGELDLTQQQYVNWLLSFIREKANKTQEVWITPTLLNGAVVDTAYPPQYRKNSIGQVEFRGNIRAITAASPSIQPIAGYKIMRATRFSVIDTSGTHRKIYNNATGSFYIDITPDGVFVCLDGLIYVPTEV